MLSYGEKLTLLMLCDLFDGLKIDSEVNREKLREAITSGNTWSLSSTVLPDIAEPSEEVVNETFDILSMWRVVERDFDRLPEPDQKAVIDAVGFGSAPKFEGFDGNNDPHFGVACHIIEKMGRYEEFSGRDLNSHTMSSLRQYRKFLATYNSLRENSHKNLGADELIQICDLTAQ